MKLTNPSLVLNFLGNDLPVGHSRTQTIGLCYIIHGSIRRRPQLLNGLRSSGSVIDIAISRDCLSTEDIIATDGDIEVVLMDDSSIIFTGFLSTKYRHVITDHGEEALALTLEDRGARLLNKPFISEGYHLFNSTAKNAILAVCAACGITVSATAEDIQNNVFKVVDSSFSCGQIIDDILYECNHVYYFDNLGQMNFFEVDVTTTSGIVVGSDKLIVRNGEAISLTKNVRTYRSARVTYTALATADNYLVYRNTTGQNDDHKYCYIELQPGEHFDGAEIYTAQEWAEATADEYRQPTLISAVNADSETSIVGSNNIVSVSNVVATVDKDDSITATIVGYGGPWLKIDCENTGNSVAYIRRLDAYASIVYESSVNIIKAGVDGASNPMQLDEQLTYLHTRDEASKHANLLSQFHAYCNSEYTFYSREKLDLGDIVQLEDTTYTGLSVSVMIIALTEYDYTSVIEYQAIGVSVFDLDKEAYHQTTDKGKAETRGRDGLSAEIQYALGTSPDHPPLSGPMLWEGEQMMWDGEPMYWDDTEWSETVPLVTRGYYLWMRSRIGEGEWAYARISATYASEPTSLGAVTSLPTETPEGQPLIPGDYFVVATEFIDSGITYRKGWVYEYKGPGWRLVDFAKAENSAKGLNSLAALLENGTDVTDSTASLYGWFKNLVAQNGIIANLITRNLQVGEGDGTANSGFRFRAREYNEYGQKLNKPDFDVYYGDKMLFSVDSTGKIFFGEGFWYNPNPGDMAIHSKNDNVVISADGVITAKGATISENSYFRGKFDCDVIKTEVQDADEYTYSSSVETYEQCFNVCKAIIDGGYVPLIQSQPSEFGYTPLFRVSVPGVSSIYYARINYYKDYGQNKQSRLYFYTQNLTQIDVRTVLNCVAVGAGSRDHLFSDLPFREGMYVVGGLTVVVITGGNMLKVDIPDSDYAAGLTRGMLYYDKSTGSVMMKL